MPLHACHLGVSIDEPHDELEIPFMPALHGADCRRLAEVRTVAGRITERIVVKDVASPPKSSAVFRVVDGIGRVGYARDGPQKRYPTLDEAISAEMTRLAIPQDTQEPKVEKGA